MTNPDTPSPALPGEGRDPETLRDDIDSIELVLAALDAPEFPRSAIGNLLVMEDPDENGDGFAFVQAVVSLDCLRRMLMHERAAFLKQGVEPTAEEIPDWIYIKDDWEVTYDWANRYDIEDYVRDCGGGEIVELGALRTLPALFCADVPTSFDEAGDPVENRVQYFPSRETAEAALAKAEASRAKGEASATPDQVRGRPQAPAADVAERAGGLD